MKKKILVVFLTLAMTQTWAMRMTHFYEASVPVASQSDADKKIAIRQGLEEVLIKLTGDPTIIDKPVIKNSLIKADYYVQEFGYSNASSLNNYTLQIHYTPSDLKKLLQKTDSALWNENRPLVLVWLMIKKNGETEMLSNSSDNALVDAMRQHSQRLGLPLIFPEMDVQDLATVPTENIFSALPSLQTAAKRYSPDAILIGEINLADSGLQTEWQLLRGREQWHWNFTANALDNISEVILKHTTQALAKHYNVVAMPNHVNPISLNVMITNITGKDDLLQLIDFVKQINGVIQTKLSQISGDNVELTLQIDGTISRFMENAALDQRLVLKTNDEAHNKIIYEWMH